MGLSSGAYFGSHSTLSQDARAASAARVALLVWMGPLSRTSRTGLVVLPGLGPERRSRSSRKAMKSALHLRGLVWTISSRRAQSKAPIIAILPAWPGAGTRRSAPFLAQTWAR